MEPGGRASPWLTRGYVPELAAWDATRSIPVEDVAELMGGAQVTAVPVPQADRRVHGRILAAPRGVPRPRRPRGLSLFSHPDAPPYLDGLARLDADLGSGEWRRRNAELFDLDELDIGYRLLSVGASS